MLFWEHWLPWHLGNKGGNKSVGMNLEIINTGMKDFILSLWGMTNVNQMPFPQCALVLRLYRWDWSSVYNLLSTRTKYIEMQLCQDANTHSVFWGAFLHGLQDFLLTLVNNESFPRTVYLIDKWPEPLVPGVNISAFRIMDRKSQGHSRKWGPGLCPQQHWFWCQWVTD